MQHIYHESGSWDDDCPRCQQWAERPFVWLDDANLMALYEATIKFMREGYMKPEDRISDTHMKAVRVMEQHLLDATRLAHCKSSVNTVMSA